MYSSTGPRKWMHFQKSFGGKCNNLLYSNHCFQIHSNKPYQQVPSTISWKISIYSLVKSAVSFMSWIVIQIVEPLYCREMVKCFVQVILLLRFDINATKYYFKVIYSDYSLTILYNFRHWSLHINGNGASGWHGGRCCSKSKSILSYNQEVSK